MFFRKKTKKAPEVVRVERMVIVEIWYFDESVPNVLQSWTWMTVDDAPDYPRAREWIASMAEVCQIHHWHIRDYDRPVYDVRLVSPITPTAN